MKSRKRCWMVRRTDSWVGMVVKAVTATEAIRRARRYLCLKGASPRLIECRLYC